jgi:outer membrane murein-binding lipoprotein Lpp
MPDGQSNKVQLGCGTLILIALIVLFFSGGTKVDDLKSNVQELTKQVQVLQEKVDSLSKAVEKR